MKAALRAAFYLLIIAIAINAANILSHDAIAENVNVLI